MAGWTRRDRAAKKTPGMGDRDDWPREGPGRERDRAAAPSIAPRPHAAAWPRTPTRSAMALSTIESALKPARDKPSVAARKDASQQSGTP